MSATMRCRGRGTVPITDLEDRRAYNDLHDQPCPGCPDCEEPQLLCGGNEEIEVGRFQDPQTGVWETEIHPCPGCRECEGAGE